MATWLVAKPFQSENIPSVKSLRVFINRAEIAYVYSLSPIRTKIRYSFWGDIDVADVRNADVTEWRNPFLLQVVDVPLRWLTTTKRVIVEARQAIPRPSKGF